MRARKFKIGVNAVATLKKANLLILCRSASENTKKEAVKLAKKLRSKLILTVSKDLSEYTHVENGKLMAILDNELAKAIMKNLLNDFTYYNMEAESNG